MFKQVLRPIRVSKIPSFPGKIEKNCNIPDRNIKQALAD